MFISYADEQVTINDKVNYTELTVGKEYTVNGVLMDKLLGKPLEVDGKEVTGSTTFTPITTDGTVNVEFTFNSSALKGQKIVVFEKVYQGDKEVASHEDINDEGQTVKVAIPNKETPKGNNNNGGLPSTGEYSSAGIIAFGISVIVLAGAVISIKVKGKDKI